MSALGLSSFHLAVRYRRQPKTLSTFVSLMHGDTRCTPRDNIGSCERWIHIEQSLHARIYGRRPARKANSSMSFLTGSPPRCSDPSRRWGQALFLRHDPLEKALSRTKHYNAPRSSPASLGILVLARTLSAGEHLEGAKDSCGCGYSQSSSPRERRSARRSSASRFLTADSASRKTLYDRDLTQGNMMFVSPDGMCGMTHARGMRPLVLRSHLFIAP